MSVKRRLGVESAKNRERLVDAASQLLYEEGHAVITSKRVAEKAGLKPQLVYYYFETMDDLLRAVIQQNNAQGVKRFVQALASPDPLGKLWEMNCDPAMSTSAKELIALANHNEALRPEIVAIAKQFRSMQINAVESLLATRGVDLKKYPAAAIVATLGALARAMGQDRALGVDEGYVEAVSFVERVLEFLSKEGLSGEEKAGAVEA